MADDNERGAGRGAKEARQDRLKLALRENLKRRKAQARERGQPQVTEPSSTDHESCLDGQVGKRGD